MYIFFSNQIEELYQELKKSLFIKGTNNTFTNRLIIVPSQAIKSWLMLQMSKDEDLMVFMGIEVMHLERAIEKFILKKKFPSSLELSLKISREAKKMATQENENWPNLKKYLNICKSSKEFSLKSEKRLYSLSLKLSHLFSQYGTYCGEMISNWEKDFSKNDFQKEIWCRLFFHGNWSYPIKEFNPQFFKGENLTNLKEENLHIHLFSINFLSKEHFQFFEKLSLHIPFRAYFLSPCLAFWSDLKSGREYYALKKFLSKQGKEKEYKLDEYMRDENSLLANFGKLGREMAKLVEESHAFTSSCFIVSENLLHIPQYEEFLFEDIAYQSGTFTLLKAIQADLAFLRNPKLTKKMEFEDASIQIHAASSPMREVQILYDNLIHLAKNDSFYPHDLIVMAPDISLYEPFIRAVFGSSSSIFPYHIMDISTPLQNPLVQEFLHLLSLVFCRLNAESLIELFQGVYFHKAQGLTPSDVEKIRKWLLESNFRWGMDVHDREEDLKNNYCSFPLTEKKERGTLKNSINRLLASLILEPSSDELLNLQFEEMPLFCIQPSDALLLGKLTSLLSSLKEDLKMMSTPTEMKLEDWVSYFHCLVKAYFNVDELSEFLSDDEMTLLNPFEELRKVAHLFHEELFSFSTVKDYLEEILRKEKLEFEGNHLNAVSFCSMLPMRSLPAKVIALLGMNEGVFPRASIQDSLDLSLKNKSDYIPTKTDFDRYLFLEALLSARHYLIISYIEDKELKTPAMSLVVQELLSYIESAYINKNPAGLLKIHPFYSFHRSYFEENSGFKSYSYFNYQLGLQFYKQKKDKQHLFINCFEAKNGAVLCEEDELVIDVKELADFAKNPIKSYFNKKLGIYLKNEIKFKEDEDFVLSKIELFNIRKQLLRESVEQTVKITEKKQILPDGFFNEIAIDKIESEAFLIEKYLKSHDITTSDIFKIDFEDSIKEPFVDTFGNWKLPPLKVYFNGNWIKIVGSFPDVCQKGLLVHGSFSKENSPKIWPEFLVFTALMELYSISAKEIIFLKCGKSKSAWYESPLNYLNDYLSYYFKSLENISPLIPEWVCDFVYEENEILSRKIENSLIEEFNPLYNDYLHWLQNEASKFSCKSFGEEWKTEASKVFLELYEKWHGK